jgi:hypothetical protein
MNEERKLSPLERVLVHQPNALKKMDRSPGLSEEDVAASTHLRALEYYRPAAIFQNAIDHRAVNESCSINDNGDVFEHLSLHNLHASAPELI